MALFPKGYNVIEIEIPIEGVALRIDEEDRGITLSAKKADLDARLKVPFKVAKSLTCLMAAVAKPLGMHITTAIRLTLQSAEAGDPVRLTCEGELSVPDQLAIFSYTTQFVRDLNDEIKCSVDLLQQSAEMGMQQKMHQITADGTKRSMPGVVYSDRKRAVALAQAVLDSGLVGSLWVVCGASRHSLHVPTASRHVTSDHTVKRITSGNWVGLTRPEHAPEAYLREQGGNRKVYKVIYPEKWYDELHKAMARDYNVTYRVKLQIIASVNQSRTEDQWELVEMEEDTIAQLSMRDFDVTEANNELLSGAENI